MSIIVAPIIILLFSCLGCFGLQLKCIDLIIKKIEKSKNECFYSSIVILCYLPILILAIILIPSISIAFAGLATAIFIIPIYVLMVYAGYRASKRWGKGKLRTRF